MDQPLKQIVDACPDRERTVVNGYAIQTSTNRPPVPDRTALVDDFMYSTDTMFLYAPSGGYKSMVAIHLAVAVANGGIFMGKQAHQARVLYVDGELSQYTFDQRFALFGDSKELDILSECYQEPSALWKLPPIHIEKNGSEDSSRVGRKQISSKGQEPNDWQSALLTLVQKNSYKLVIFDNVRTLTDGLNENDSAAVTPLNNLVKRLRHNGCAVLVVHHTRKSDGESGEPVYSGTTNFLTVYSSCLGIEKVGQDGVRFHIEKEREQSVGDYFRENQWRLSSNPKEGFVQFDAFSAEVAQMRKLVEEIKAGRFTTKKSVIAAARARGIRIDSSKGAVKALHEKLTEEDVVGPDQKDFDEMLRSGIEKANGNTSQFEAQDDF